MTREEAIRILSTRDAHGVLCGYTSGVTEAIDMAVEALQADRPHGEWIDIDNYYRLATCSHCHKVTMFEKWGEYTKPYDFCPNCGAKMKGENNESNNSTECHNNESDSY